MSVGIVYSKKTGNWRRIIIDGDLKLHGLNEGEALIEVSDSEYRADGRGMPVNVNDLLSKRGIEVKPERFVVLDQSGDVINVIKGDYDEIPGQIEKHDNACIGWKKRGGILVKKHIESEIN